MTKLAQYSYSQGVLDFFKTASIDPAIREAAVGMLVKEGEAASSPLDFFMAEGKQFRDELGPRLGDALEELRQTPLPSFELLTVEEAARRKAERDSAERNRNVALALGGTALLGGLGYGAYKAMK